MEYYHRMRCQTHVLLCGHILSTFNKLKNVLHIIRENFKNPQQLRHRTHLAPVNDTVDKINFDLLQLLPETASSFRIVNTVINQDQAIQFPIEFLNSLQPPGMPSHNLILEKIEFQSYYWEIWTPPCFCNSTGLIIKAMKHIIIEINNLSK